jgi:hypothetical protein
MYSGSDLWQNYYKHPLIFRSFNFSPNVIVNSVILLNKVKVN